MRQQSDGFMTYTDRSQGSTDCECQATLQYTKIEEANDTDLYDRARGAVISWENSKKERNARR